VTLKREHLNVREFLDDYKLNKDCDGWPFREHDLHCGARHFPVCIEHLKTFDKDPIIGGQGEHV